jgi:hypothetical protein
MTTPRFEAYRRAFEDHQIVLDWRIDLIAQRGSSVLITTDESMATGGVLVWGAELEPLAFSGNRTSQRTARLSVPIQDTALLPQSPSSLLHPDARNRIRIYAGLVGPTGASELWLQATMLIVTATATTEEGVTVLDVGLADVTRPVSSTLLHGFIIDRGTPVENVVARLLSDVYRPDEYLLAPTGWTMPAASFTAGSARDLLVNQLLEGCGHELTTTAEGLVISRLIPSSSLAGSVDQWSYGGDTGIPIDKAERIWSSRSPHGWKVDGGSFADENVGVSTIVYDRDPSSQGFFSGAGEVMLGSSRFPFIQSAGQGEVAGYAQLRRNGDGPLSLEVWTIPNPALDEGDLVSVTIPELAVDHVCRVMEADLPIQVDGLMRMRLRAVFDPQLGYRPPTDPNAGCLTSFVDPFDRADENLETTTAEAGSPDWREIGFSWGVVGFKAIQRYEGWSVALVNTPICTADMFAEIEIAKLPDGRWLGAVVRSTGGADGYVALVSPGGVVSLEMWLNGAAAETLAVHDSGGSLEGRKVKVSVVGSNVKAWVNGQEVLSVNDDRRVGTFLGMVGYGAFAPNPIPSVESFAGGTQV